MLKLKSITPNPPIHTPPIKPSNPSDVPTVTLPQSEISPDYSLTTELKPFRFWCQKVLPLVYDDSLSYYELLCKVVEYLNNTIKAMDESIVNIQNLYQGYIELQNYVNYNMNDIENYLNHTVDELEGYIQSNDSEIRNFINKTINTLETYINTYFSSLDVQNEINNKLDAMFADGTLDMAIARYIQECVIVFKNVDEMKHSKKILNGVACRTLGYYSPNDGGGSLYIIRASKPDETDNGGTVILCDNGLIAELVIEGGCITPRQFGAKGDGVTDDTLPLQKSINTAFELNQTLFIPSGKFKITKGLTIPSSSLASADISNMNITGNGMKNTIITCDFSTDKTESALYLEYSSKITISNFSIIGNWKAKSGIEIYGSSMVIHLYDIFCFTCGIGFNLNSCIATVENCFANSCFTGFKIEDKVISTGTSLISCYASQCLQTYDGKQGEGFYINSLYSTLNSCGSDSNYIGYNVKRGGTIFNACGAELNDINVLIDFIENKEDHHIAIFNSFIHDQKANGITIKAVVGYAQFNNCKIDTTHNVIEDLTTNRNALNFVNCVFFKGIDALNKPLPIAINGIAQKGCKMFAEKELATTIFRGTIVSNSVTLRFKKVHDVGIYGFTSEIIHIKIRNGGYSSSYSLIDEEYTVPIQVSTGISIKEAKKTPMVREVKTSDETYDYINISVSDDGDFEYNIEIRTTDNNSPVISEPAYLATEVKDLDY